MPCAPSLQEDTKRKLKEISPHLDIKWNYPFERWEIWFVCEGSNHSPYIIMNVPPHPGITAQTYQQLRKSFWWSREIKYNTRKMLEISAKKRKNLEKQEEDDAFQAGKEVVPLMKSLIDAKGSSHGQSKFMHPGFGESKINA